MFEKLWNAQTDATLRRVHLTFRDSTTGDNKDPGTLTGIKANVRLNGTGTLVTTTNDVAKLNQTDHLGAGYVEFTAAEFTAFDHGELIISVSGIAGVKVEDAQATLYTFNPNDPGATAAQIASQVRTELAAELGDIVALNARVPSDPADESLIESATTTVLNAVNALNDLDAAGVRAAVGLTAADLDTQLGALPDAAAIVAAILDADLETNGATTVKVRLALQLAAALPAGVIAGILAGAGAQTVTLKSASGQPFLSYATDELGNRASVTITPIT